MGDKLPTIKKASIKKPRKPQKIKIERIKETEYKQRKKPKQKRLNRKLVNQYRAQKKAYARELEKEEQLKRRQGEDILRRMTSTARKERAKQENLIKKAKDVLKLAENRVQDARYQGVRVNVLFNFEDPRYHIKYLEDQVKAGKGLSDDDIRYLRSHGNPTHYDTLIKYEFSFADPSRAINGVIPVKTKYISQYEINKLRKKQVANPEGLTQDEVDKLMQWVRATERATAVNVVKDKDVVEIPDKVPTQSDEEYTKMRERMVNRLHVSRSIQFGGNSQLINKLSYSYECGPVGPKIVKLVQDAMKDPVVWNKLEHWYRTTQEPHDQLEARGSKWYDGVVKGFLHTLVDFLLDLSDIINVDSDLLAEAQTLAAEYGND